MTAWDLQVNLFSTQHIPNNFKAFVCGNGVGFGGGLPFLFGVLTLFSLAAPSFCNAVPLPFLAVPFVFWAVPLIIWAVPFVFLAVPLII